ncbi:MAG: DNA polymerase III subunit beta [Corynebacteriales bacterium]|nr:DNA polymerase III subunit beta [Mycobacteriales bacterium]
MKFQVERDPFADAVAWTAKSLPARPPVPVLAGVLLDVTGAQGPDAMGRLTVSGFDYEVGSIMGMDVQADSTGQALVSGRLLAEITRSLPAQPVQVSSDGSRVEITCGSARFTLPTMPVEDYPALPEMPTVAGAVDPDVFAAAVAQAAIAAGRDDTLPMLTGVHMEIEGEKLSLVATDRYRLAIRELVWRPGDAATQRRALVPARTLLDTAKALTSTDEVAIALSDTDAGAGLIGFSGGGRRTTTRLLDGEYPPVRNLLPDAYSATATVSTAVMVEVVKRVALVAERNTPVRLTFAEGVLTVEAGSSDDARASESMDSAFEGEELTIAFNPQYLLDGLGAIVGDAVRFSFTNPLKPAVMTGLNSQGEEELSYRYVLMPIRVAQ